MKIQLSALVLGAVLTQAALAADDADPPALVGRVSFVQGNAGLQAGDAAAEQVELNRPVTIGDRIRTESQGLLEVSLGTAAVRLDENTDVTVANLDDDITQLQLDGGALSLHVFELGRNENVEIDTPTATVHVLEAGDYRIDASDDGTTRLAVRHGDAEIDGGGGPVHVRDQQQLVFAGSDEPADVIALTTPDDFDQWSMARDRHFDDQKSSQYVSREVVGYEDLDSNGTWDTTPDYGAVWYPNNVADDWAPYRDGNWVWVAPWGWSWVDRAPWGFAPFHYGRWAFVGRRWCWVPGPRATRPVYAPALVAWNGGARGPGVSVGLSITSRPSRWIPLGPREVYVPAHQVSPRYLRNVNVSNTIIVNNAVITNAYRGRTRDVRYVNSGAPHAIGTRETLARGARPTPALRALPPRRPSVARGVVEREGVPVAVQPPHPMPSRDLRNAGPGGRGQATVQRPPMQARPQFQQRAQIQERAQVQQRNQVQERDQVQQRNQGQRQEQQFQQRLLQQRQEEQGRQQQHVAGEIERQGQLRAQEAQREQQARQQQAQFQAQQAERQNQARLQQAQREQQVRQQQQQVQAQQAQRQARELAPRPERRDVPRGPEHSNDRQ